jgi:hypothetical protein
MQVLYMTILNKTVEVDWMVVLACHPSLNQGYKECKVPFTTNL